MKESQEIEPEDVSVVLHPILGVQPSVYVPVLYGIAVIVILFFMLLFPGIRNHGTLMTFITTPGQVSVRVDGVRIGTAPGTHFVPSGLRELEFVRPGFTSRVTEVEVKGRRFGSWPFPRRDTLRIDLSTADPGQLIRTAAEELSLWGLIGEASGQYQFPPLARALGADLAAAGAASRWPEFTELMLPQLNSQALLNDVLAAGARLHSVAAVATPAGIAGLVQSVAAADARTPGFAVQLAQALGNGRLSAEFAESDFYSGSARRFAGSLESLGNEISLVPSELLRLPLGLSFVRVSGFALAEGADFAARGGDIPRAVSGNFIIGVSEVPASAFLAFLDANPVNRITLADESAFRETPTLPVSGVSWFDAQMFASWYTDLLPAGLAARLPTEEEWDAALRAAEVSGAPESLFAASGNEGPQATQPGVAQLDAMLGNLWEWTADAYAPFSYLYDSAPTHAAHRVVRGGGYATDRRGFDPADRGSLDPSTRSPFVGFRLAIEETDR